jgi:3-deoxy-alpha-D-manno-octulosonate 8-oxidase
MSTYPNTKNVPSLIFGPGSLSQLSEVLAPRRTPKGRVVFLLDHFFDGSQIMRSLPLQGSDQLIIIDSRHEPSVDDVDQLCASVLATGLPDAVVGIGGGCTLDSAKALSNLLTNPGKAEDYQGWDLVKNPGVYKIGIPTISGTGAEASRTCVLMNYRRNLKLGMNSDHTIFDQLILDSELSRSVPRQQYFYTAMDTYIHCIESLAGTYRHPVADAYSMQALELCREVFLSDDMMDDAARDKLMVASYLGGCAIANSFLGIVHPISAGLSIVLGVHHCEANCLAFDALGDYYPEQHAEFRLFMTKQQISLRKNLCLNLGEEEYHRLYLGSIIHEKPLANALGPGFRQVLNEENVRSLFSKI